MSLQRPPLVLYSKPDCPLCDRLEAMIRAHRRPVAVEKRDIDLNERWRRRFALRIPVVEHEGRVILEGRPHEDRVRAVLDALAEPPTPR